MPPSTAGTGLAAATALSRGMQDMSMGDPSLGETQNFCAHAALKVAMRLWCPCSMLTVGACGALADEFKENNEQQDSLNDIDDFERRLEGGAARKAPAPAAKAAGKPAAARQALPVAGKMKGADYVDAAKRAGAGNTCAACRAAGTEAEGTALKLPLSPKAPGGRCTSRWRLGSLFSLASDGVSMQP